MSTRLIADAELFYLIAQAHYCGAAMRDTVIKLREHGMEFGDATPEQLNTLIELMPQQEMALAANEYASDPASFAVPLKAQL